MKCRVLNLPADSGAKYTALDQILLENAERRNEFTIAFTEWTPTVSIGNSQNLMLDVNVEACGRRSVPIVRRLSGGQAVYVDGNYIVASVAGPRESFPASITKIRNQLSEAVGEALREVGVPATFYEPDNLIVGSPRERTLGNSGQVIKSKSVAVHGSVRYDLPEESLQCMLDVLKTNGCDISAYASSVRDSLASAKEFTQAGKSEIRERMAAQLMRAYGCSDFYEDTLKVDEIARLEQAAADLTSQGRLKGKEGYKSRGVCYFYLNGRCIVPEIARLLGYNSPSTHIESTLA
jgi:lipoate-protein ligase A